MGTPVIPLLLPVTRSEYVVGIANLAVSKSTAGVACREHVVVDEGTRGFTQAFNRGVRELLPREWVCVSVLAGDLRYEKEGWLARMREALLSDPAYAIVGPSVRCGTYPQSSGRPGMALGYKVVRHLNFTGALVRRAALESVGLLDESYKHAGCDFDWVHRAQEQGWKAVWVRDVWCNHDWKPGKYPAFEAVDRPLYYSRWTREGIRVN